MGRNRASSSASVPEVQYDATKFLGDKAQAFYDRYGGKNCNVEKEFKKEGLNLDDVFATYKLDRLAAKPAMNGLSEVVKEFYANIMEKGNVGLSWVRGNNVDYSSRVINAYYGIPDHFDSCDYIRIARDMEGDPKNRLDRIAPTFGVIETGMARNGRIFWARDLDRQKKFLHRFICERILPSTHSNEVHWRRALLMHCMLSGLAVNIGRIIQDEIFHTAQSIGNCNYNFPCLITALTGKAKSSLVRGVRDLVPGTAVDKKFLLRGASQQDEGTSQQGEGPMGDEIPREEVPVEEQNRGMNMDWGMINERLTAVEGRFADFQEMQYVQNYQNSMWQTRMESMWTEHIAEQQSNYQDLLQRLPPPRPYEPYIPPQNLVWDGPTWDDVRDQQREQQQQQQPGPIYDQGSSPSEPTTWDSLFGPSHFGPPQ